MAPMDAEGWPWQIPGTAARNPQIMCSRSLCRFFLNEFKKVVTSYKAGTCGSNHFLFAKEPMKRHLLTMARPTDELIRTRTTLLERLRDWRDESSWQDFFDTYWRLIYGVAVKAGLTSVEAEDVVQETMISVAKNIPTFKYDRKIGSFKGWLLNMTRWRVTDQFRKRLPASHSHVPLGNVGGKVESPSQVVEPASLNWEALWDAEWEENLLNAAIARVKRRLDPEKFQIFDFYVNKGWPPNKVAKAFGISVGQVYLAKHRILENIKKEIQRLQKEMI